ncbi:MAG: bacteriohemerythrin [Thermodesulfobacteriota bacterium]
MAIFAWKNEYEVGIEEIDRQHRELVAILDDLYTAMLNARGVEQVESTLERLTQYTKNHFATEERLFKKHAYPEEREHAAEHAAMLARVAKFRREHQHGKAVGVELMHYLKGWFVEHLQTTDHRYVPFFRALGVAKEP